MNAFPWMGFIFWAGLFTWLGVRSWSRYLAEQERQKTLRAFAERGTPLDKEMMEKLFPPTLWVVQQQGGESSPQGTVRGLTIGGIVMLSAGVGLLIGAQLIGRMEPEALFGMSAGGTIVGCVGLGLITAAWALRRMQASAPQNGSKPGDDAR